MSFSIVALRGKSNLRQVQSPPFSSANVCSSDLFTLSLLADVVSLFRQPSICSRILTAYCRSVGTLYTREVIRPYVLNLMQQGLTLEVQSKVFLFLISFHFVLILNVAYSWILKKFVPWKRSTTTFALSETLHKQFWSILPTQTASFQCAHRSRASASVARFLIRYHVCLQANPQYLSIGET